MANFINKNLTAIINAYRQKKSGICLEGSSRSGKSWSWIDSLIWFSSHLDFKFTANIIRETQASFKTTLYDDFNKRLPQFGIQSPFEGKKEVNMFWILGNKINLLGADNPSKFEGATCDFSIYNEILDIDQVIFDQQEQRCKLFWIADWNPKVTSHWVFDKIIRRSDVAYCHSTFLDNLPFISEKELRKILSYEPTHPDDRYKPENERRPHPTNIQEGTADDYRWKVYGLGVRCVPEGLIFPNVIWIDKFPENVDKLIFGLDFGFTNSPSALTKGATIGNNLYLQKLIYTPTDNVNILAELLEKTLGYENHCWADSAEGGDAGMIADLRKMGFKVFAAKKWPGCITYRNDLIKRYKIHIVRDEDFKKEQENYRYRMINGIKLNQPVDEYNHCFSANTKIFTLNGNKNIIDINETDYVLTSKGFNKILKIFNNGYKEIFEYNIKFINFEINLNCTPNHKILNQKGWTKVSEIKKGDILYLNNLLMEKNITYTKEKNIIREEQKECTLLYGIITLEKYLKDFIYIIKMKILLIIQLIILNLLKLKFIKVIILNKGLKIILNGLETLFKKELNNQLNGIKQKKVKNGIFYLQKKQDLEQENMVRLNVRNVQMNLLKRHIKMNFVLKSVKQNIEGNQKLIMLLRNANGVQMNLNLINILKRDFVHTHVVQEININNKKTQNVYDLMIDNKHEYFANNILVHNCWDAVGYMCQHELRAR
jgi:hypothetical protein